MATIAERRIAEAMVLRLRSGQAPLHLSGVPAEQRKEIVSLREMLGRLEDDEQRRHLRRQLDYKLLKLNMQRKRPLALEDLPGYRERVIDRLGG